MSNRTIQRVTTSMPVTEGAGVHLHRAFANPDAHLFDPFLLLDDFRGETPEDYQKGFPWHPHRGIETITYVLDGHVEHGDSLGNKGDIAAGDVQWMTAGSGIIHQEMPKGNAKGQLEGFQLWANLPAADKMMPPRYRGIQASEIPVVNLSSGIQVRVICGAYQGTPGPVTDVVIEPEYLDVVVPSQGVFTHPTLPNHTVFAYVYGGTGKFEQGAIDLLGNRSLILYSQGDRVVIEAAEEPLRFLLVSGKPLKEPIAWGGPIVMNTQEELQLAFDEFKAGTFIKHR